MTSSRQPRLGSPPATSFASDNTTGMHPRVLEAMVAANAGPAIAYGADPWTAQLEEQFAELFGQPVGVFPCFGGTGANLVGLQALLRPWEAVICPASAHINTDECGAAERILGNKLLDVPTADGKLRPADVIPLLAMRGDEHHVQPRVMSVTQSTEWGTVYSLDELGALGDTARGNELYLHLDGARFANAVAATGGDAAAVIEAGVDVMTFGGTKCGTGYGDTVLVFRPELLEPMRFIRKQAGQLVSKMRFVAAQMSALLEDDLWLHLGANANAMAALLAQEVAALPGVGLTRPPAANAVFARITSEAVETLQTWSFFWVWDELVDEALTEVRWMTSWETTGEDVAAFVSGLSLATAR